MLKASVSFEVILWNSSYVPDKTLAQVFSCEFWEFLKTPFLTEHLWWLLLQTVFNPTSMNATIPLHKFPSSSTPTCSPDWCCADFCKCISSKKEPFCKMFLTLLSHQHHLVEYYLTMTKIALEIFQVITCTLGVMYNVNVRHTESLMLIKKVSLIKFIYEFLVVVGGGISYISWEVL